MMLRSSAATAKIEFAQRISPNRPTPFPTKLLAVSAEGSRGSTNRRLNRQRMNYPLKLSFKLLALASQIYIRDANGELLGYVRQKLLKLKEDINVFADEQQTTHLYNIKADRMIDFSARYNFTDSQGRIL